MMLNTSLHVTGFFKEKIWKLYQPREAGNEWHRTDAGGIIELPPVLLVYCNGMWG